MQLLCGAEVPASGLQLREELARVGLRVAIAARKQRVIDGAYATQFHAHNVRVQTALENVGGAGFDSSMSN